LCDGWEFARPADSHDSQKYERNHLSLRYGFCISQRLGSLVAIFGGRRTPAPPGAKAAVAAGSAGSQLFEHGPFAPRAYGAASAGAMSHEHPHHLDNRFHRRLLPVA
jgi:hypothetical protein